MTFEKAKEIAEKLGWKVESDTWGSFDGNRCITFSKTSPAGEDFSFEIWSNEDESIATETRSYANDFDEEEHVKLMLDSRGAPSMKELVTDAEKVKKMVNDLADAFDAADNGEEVHNRRFKTRAEASNWLYDEFPVTRERPLCDIIDSILMYADDLSGEEQEDYLMQMFSGTMGIEDREIKEMCWNKKDYTKVTLAMRVTGEFCAEVNVPDTDEATLQAAAEKAFTAADFGELSDTDAKLVSWSGEDGLDHYIGD